MQTLNDLYLEYRDKIYPGGTGHRQGLETHQAFFAGALTILRRLHDLADLPEAEAIAELSRLEKECISVMAARGITLKSKN